MTSKWLREDAGGTDAQPPGLQWMRVKMREREKINNKKR